MRYGVWAALGLLGALCAATRWVPTAAALASVRLEASLTPDQLGHSTTIGFGFQISGPGGEAPPPLTHVALKLPAGIDYITTTLGLAICQPANLELEGPDGCSPNSRIGFGQALVEVPFSHAGEGQETPTIQAFMGPPHNGNIVVVFYAVGDTPVSAQVIFEGELVPGFGADSGTLDNAIPLIPGVPEGPDVSIRSVQTTIGPKGLRYSRLEHGRIVSFTPTGVSVPATCPRGGFRFAADFSFADGSTALAKSSVPCPRRLRDRLD
jgi:hypothetical protein